MLNVPTAPREIKSRQFPCLFGVPFQGEVDLILVLIIMVYGLGGWWGRSIFVASKKHLLLRCVWYDSGQV